MFFCFTHVMNKIVKEDFSQEILYVENFTSLIKSEEQENKKEKVERGVIIIDLM